MRDPCRREPRSAAGVSLHLPVHRTGEICARLATAQHGVVARRQLVAAGMTRHVIGGLLRRGHLHPVHREVYAVGHPRLTQQGRWMAAVLSCGEGAALSHRSAGGARGIVREGTTTTVSVPRRIVRPGLRLVTTTLQPDEVTVEKGIPMTTVARTLLDLAGVLDRPALERALHQAEADRRADATPLSVLLDRYPRRAGTPLLRALLDDLRGTGAQVTKSVMEERFRALLAEHGIPLPRTNAFVEGLEVDCLWSRERVVVELDSRAFHDRSRTFERDRLRDRTLHVAGYVVVRITWRELRDRPERVVHDVRELLRARGDDRAQGAIRGVWSASRADLQSRGRSL